MATNEGSDVRTEVEANSSPSEHHTDAANGSPSSNNPGGSVFSSPKILTGTGNNPFAVRSSPSRSNNENNSSTTDAANHAPSCIIAPSKFGSASPSAPPSGLPTPPTTTSSSTNNSSSSHSVKESQDASECNGSSSKPLLRPSLIGGSGSTLSSSTSSATPPASNHSILKPATLGNPFARAVDLPVDDATNSPTHHTTSAAATTASARRPSEPAPSLLLPSRLTVNSSAASPAAAASGSSHDDQTSSLETPAVDPAPLSAGLQRPSLTSGSLFSSGPAVVTPTACTANFVFGQKLHERVANPNHTSLEPTSNGADANPTTNLFTVVPKDKSEMEAASTNGIAASKSLSDSARELEEARAAKRKYDEVTVVTGEEDEQNALQVYGKLFTFDKVQGTWVERGRGTLRLNDKQMDNHALQSRLVMRTQGCLRVILNTKIWAEMTIDKTSSKSIRLTAVDGDQIKVFLLMASLKDTETLFNALEWRLATLRAQQSRVAAAAAVAAAATSSSIPEAESTLPSHDDDDDDDDGSSSSPKRRALPADETDDQSIDETKKKRSE